MSVAAYPREHERRSSTCRRRESRKSPPAGLSATSAGRTSAAVVPEYRIFMNAGHAPTAIAGPIQRRANSESRSRIVPCLRRALRGKEGRHRPRNATSRAWQCLRSHGFSDRERDENCALAIAWMGYPFESGGAVSAALRPEPGWAQPGHVVVPEAPRVAAQTPGPAVDRRRHPSQCLIGRGTGPRT